MTDISIITERIFYLGTFVIVGFIATILKYIKPSLSDGISTLLSKLTIPALVLTSFSTLDLNTELLKSGILMLIVTFVLISTMLLIGKLCSKALGLSGVTASAHTFLSACGNVTFMGYPIIGSIFGAEGLYYAMLYTLINNSFVWVLSVYSIVKHSGSKHGNMFKKLLNPSSISLFLGFFIMLLNIKFPNFILKPMQVLGDCTTPLSMIFIGITLASIRFSKLSSIWKSFIIVIVKMITIPAILVFVLPVLSKLNLIAPTGLKVLLLLCAMPCTSIYAVLSKTYGGDPEYAAQTILVTTVCSFFTVPLIYYLILNFGNF